MNLPRLNNLVMGLLLFASAALLSACSATAPKAAQPAGPIRKADFRQAPQLAHLASHAREFSAEMYPRVCALLLDGSARPPQQFDLFVGPLKSGNRGEANLVRRQIRLNSEYFTNRTDGFEQFDKVFTHEMAHMATQSRHWARFCWYSGVPSAGYWGESIADYARFKLLGTNGWSCPECNTHYPHYTSGYSCGGAFLLLLDAHYGTNVIRQLVRELRDRTYSDEFFAKRTGRNLDALWAEFQKTDAFKPTAADAFALQQALGYRNGRAPKDVLARFRKFVDEHGDDFTKAAIKGAQPVKDIKTLCMLYLYLTQPGGPPERFLYELGKKNLLPGKRQGEKGSISHFFDSETLESRVFPASRTIEFRKFDEPSVYHYTVSRASVDSEWTLDRAWRTSAAGEEMEDLPLTTK